MQVLLVDAKPGKVKLMCSGNTFSKGKGNGMQKTDHEMLPLCAPKADLMLVARDSR